MTAHTAAVLTAAIVTVGTMIDSLELLAEQRRTEWAFDWRVLQTQYSLLLRHPRLERVTARLVTGSGLTALGVVRLLAAPATVAALATHSPLAFPACLAVVLTGALIRTRLVYGLDGADQMGAVVWIALTIYAAAPSQLAATVAICFVAAQFLLSYLTSGIAKAISPQWRGGTAICNILATQGYGSRWCTRAFAPGPRSLAMGWSVILFETLGPVLALVGGVAFLAFAAMACLFHAGNAAVMGLNGFFWAFLSALPCVAYATHLLHGAVA